MLIHVLSRLSLVGVVALVGCNKSEGPTSPTPTAPTTPLYMVIGASDATGYGSSVACVPFDIACANGTGYAQRIIRRYRQERGQADYRNYGIPGQVLSRAIADLGRQVGREVVGNFIDLQAPFVKPETTVVSIFAGGNDANIIGEAVRAGLGGFDPRVFIDAQLAQWGSDYGAMIDSIKRQAPSTRIVILNVPNLAAAPYVANIPTLERSILQRIAVGLADKANGLTAKGAIVVDLLCEPRFYNPGNYFSDGFHPNDNGYALIAELAYPAIADGLARSPLASCPSRTLLPAY